jgi:hypothetical protein
VCPIKEIDKMVTGKKGRKVMLREFGNGKMKLIGEDTEPLGKWGGKFRGIDGA